MQPYLNDIIQGKRNVTPLLALKLEKTLEISAEFWIRMQTEYNIAVKRNAVQ